MEHPIVQTEYNTCADPESFVRGGPTLTTFYEGRELRSFRGGGSGSTAPLWIRTCDNEGKRC